jgi:hypothetical protein
MCVQSKHQQAKVMMIMFEGLVTFWVELVTSGAIRSNGEQCFSYSLS